MKKASPSMIIKRNNYAFSNEVHPNKNVKNVNYEEKIEIDPIRGVMMQYCMKGSAVMLRKIRFIRNDTSKMLLITVENSTRKTDTYTILLTKDVCPYTFKDSHAFVIKVFDTSKKLKSMTFKTENKEEKLKWLQKYTINMDSAQLLLDLCIEEVERRRFHLGVKKRNEGQNDIKMTPYILVKILNNLKEKKMLNFTNENQWSITNLEKLIQLLLNEISEPLIPYINQKSVRKFDKKRFHAPNETRRCLNSLSNRNRAMLSSLLAHMERLSKYYLIIMSSPRTDLELIRQNICQRLAPIVFRLQEEFDNEEVFSRACELLYHTMLCVTGAM